MINTVHIIVKIACCMLENMKATIRLAVNFALFLHGVTQAI